ncbi:MAG: aminoacyl-histidine dipeptidase [Bacteroidaceae bacterium]|nr:aminoacyl-histidine dipeptidase [Bacteroidaceae bacterium]MBR1521571.1 aminoacyl-histidine dipeptidase [Bacteroidaceae bacterium]
MNPIEELSPKGVWRNFYALTQIPRPSGHTEKVANFLVDFAKKNGAEAYIDDAGNVIMKKGATAGYEDRETTVLQAHMDMVPQKTKESTHNFETDPLDVYIDGEWVTARNTTLGADDGMGVAAAMAIIEDDTVEHGPIEVLITRDEETGMDGAFQLKGGQLSGKYLLNLDSETEGEITIGCAGGMDVVANMEYQELNVNPDNMLCYNIVIKGLLGGHSGIEIFKGRANANKLMARILFAAVNTQQAWLVNWHGGNMRNAIPRECEATVLVPKAQEAEFLALIEKSKAIFTEEFKDIETNGFQLTATPTLRIPAKAVPQEIQENLINAVMAAHDGVLRYTPSMPDLVETSSNLAIINVGDGKAEVICLARSSQDSMKLYLCNGLVGCFSMAGMKVSLEGGYSGWQPNPKSALVASMSDIYEKLYGKKPIVGACHAGLECGIIGVNYPEMDMASYGPTLVSPHTPSEACLIPTVQKFYDFTLEILKNIPKKK